MTGENSGAPTGDGRAVAAWALYDWANSAFATVVLAGFFPILFHDYWSQGVSPAEITARLGFANAAASLLVALSSPVLGAIADRTGAKRRFFAIFMLLGV
jgi:UMF1 family MFS transporter